jgi:hypothetical protein
MTDISQSKFDDEGLRAAWKRGITDRFDAIEARLDYIERRLENIERRLDLLPNIAGGDKR